MRSIRSQIRKGLRDRRTQIRQAIQRAIYPEIRIRTKYKSPKFVRVPFDSLDDMLAKEPKK